MSEWTIWRCLNEMYRNALGNGHSLQTYGFTRSWHQSECCFSSPRVMNCCWQMSHANQVPSSCNFSRCTLSWTSVLKVSTWVRLCISTVNTNMTLQFWVHDKPLPTVRSVMWSSVAVYKTFMNLQVAELVETLVTSRTLVNRSTSSMQSHVTVENSRLTKRPVTHVTCVRFLSRVDSHVTGEISWRSKRLVTHLTFVRFLSCVDSHVTVEISRLSKHLLTHLTLVWFLSTVNSAVPSKVSSPCKSFAANSTFKSFGMTMTVCCKMTNTALACHRVDACYQLLSPV